MKKRELVDVRTITKELIGNWLFSFVVLYFVYFITYSIITKHIGSEILKIFIAKSLQGITLYFIWKNATQKTFQKNNTISRYI